MGNELTVQLARVTHTVPAQPVPVQPALCPCISTKVCPVVFRGLPETYTAHPPPSKRYWYASVHQTPPLPALNVADTNVPVHTLPEIGVAILRVGPTGCGLTVKSIPLSVPVLTGLLLTTRIL